MQKPDNDFLADVIRRIAAAVESTQAETPDRIHALRQVEQGIRHDYGHDRITIRLGTQARDAQIRREYTEGRLTLREIAARHGLTSRRIIQIAKGSW